MTRLLMTIIAFACLATSQAADAADRTTPAQRDAVLRFVNPTLYGRDNPTTLEGRTAASGLTANQALEIMRRFGNEELKSYQDGKYSEGQYNEQMKTIERWIVETLKLTGFDPDKLPEQIEGQRIEADKVLDKAIETAKGGLVDDLPELEKATRTGLRAERDCQLLGSACAHDRKTMEKILEVLVTWTEAFGATCQDQRQSYDMTLLFAIGRQLQLLGVGFDEQAKYTPEEYDERKRQQAILDKLLECKVPVWIASVALDLPEHEREAWMIHCGNTPHGRWVIMRTEGAAAATHMFLKGELQIDAKTGKGNFWFDAVDRNSDRGSYRETGWGEMTDIEGAPEYKIITLHGTWSDRVSDGKGGYVAKNIEFGDYTYQAAQRPDFCTTSGEIVAGELEY